MHRRSEIDWARSSMTPKAVPAAPLGLLARQCHADADVEAAAAIVAPTNTAMRKRTASDSGVDHRHGRAGNLRALARALPFAFYGDSCRAMIGSIVLSQMRRRCAQIRKTAPSQHPARVLE